MIDETIAKNTITYKKEIVPELMKKFTYKREIVENNGRRCIKRFRQEMSDARSLS